MSEFYDAGTGPVGHMSGWLSTSMDDHDAKFIAYHLNLVSEGAEQRIRSGLHRLRLAYSLAASSWLYQGEALEMRHALEQRGMGDIVATFPVVTVSRFDVPERERIAAIMVPDTSWQVLVLMENGASAAMNYS